MAAVKGPGTRHRHEAAAELVEVPVHTTAPLFERITADADRVLVRDLSQFPARTRWF